MVKINVDASVANVHRRGVVAAVCREHDSNFLGASVIIFRGITDPTTLEALAVREALALAKDLNQFTLHPTARWWWTISSSRFWLAMEP